MRIELVLQAAKDGGAVVRITSEDYQRGLYEYMAYL